jgi:hypothetical protein
VRKPPKATSGQVAFPVNAVSHGGVAHDSGPGFDPPAASTDVVAVVGGGLVEVEVEGGGVDDVGGGLVGGGLVGGGVEDGGTISQAPMSRDAFVAGPS